MEGRTTYSLNFGPARVRMMKHHCFHKKTCETKVEKRLVKTAVDFQEPIIDDIESRPPKIYED